MNQYAGSESKYLKAADLQGRSIKCVIEAVSIVEFEREDGSKYQKPALKLKGKEKMVVANPTTVQELGQAYGWQSESWVGQEIGLSVKHYAALGKDGIVVTALGQPERFVEDDVPF